MKDTRAPVSNRCGSCPNQFKRESTRRALENAEEQIQEIEQQLTSLRGLNRATFARRTRLREQLAYQQAMKRVATRFRPRELTPSDIDQCGGAFTRVQPFITVDGEGTIFTDDDYEWTDNVCGAGPQLDRSPVHWGRTTKISE